MKRTANAAERNARPLQSRKRGGQRPLHPLEEIARAHAATLALLREVSTRWVDSFQFRLAEPRDLADATRTWLRRTRRVFAKLWRTKKRVAKAAPFFTEAGTPTKLPGFAGKLCHSAHCAAVCLAEAFEPPRDVMELGRLPAGKLGAAQSFHSWVDACSAAAVESDRFWPLLASEFAKARRIAIDSDGLLVRWRDLPPNWQEIFQALDRGPLQGNALLDAAQGTERGSSGTLKNDLANMVTLGILSRSRAKGAAGYSQKARFHGM